MMSKALSFYQNAWPYSEQNAERQSRARRAIARIQAHAQTWLRTYAQVYFGAHPGAGLLCMAATFLVPYHGVAGLCGLLLGNAWARALECSDEHIREGYYGVNGLLLGLALGLYFRFSAELVLALVIGSLLATAIAAALRNLADRYLGIPMLSLPFVLASWICLMAMRSFSEIEVALAPTLVSGWGSHYLPAAIEHYLRALGACFFQLSAAAGLITFIALVWISRWSALLSIVGFASGHGVYTFLGAEGGQLANGLMGFNFMLVAIAMGGVFTVLSVRSIALGCAAGAACAILTAAMWSALELIHLPVLAMPFVLTTQCLLFALAVGQKRGKLALVEGAPASPERNLSRATSYARRYPDPKLPAVLMPVMGRWLITQGHDGEHTHQGLWRHAWDFEVIDEQGMRFRGRGMEPRDYYAYGAPVMAPAAGKVVNIVDHVEDNQIGDVNNKDNWGNLIVLWHYGDVYTALCHLQKGSIAVEYGQTVSAGQLLARVGNSGRSPVPHLHFQFQSSATMGSPTRYGVLLHYAVEDGCPALRDYRTYGIPEQGHIVEQTTKSNYLAQAIKIPLGHELTWSVTRPEGSNSKGPNSEKSNSERPNSVETWHSDIDLLGGQWLRDDTGAAARMYCDLHYLTVLDYSGPSNALLGLFYLGAARIPFVESGWAMCRDRLIASALTSPTARLMHEIVRPFAELGAVSTNTRADTRGDYVITRTEISDSRLVAGRGRLPDCIEIAWLPGLGPVGMRAWRQGKLLLEARRTDVSADTNYLELGYTS